MGENAGVLSFKEIRIVPWYVVQTLAQKELVASSCIEQQLGLTTYYPEVLQRRRRRVQMTAFFPCYFFVTADLGNTSLSSLNATPGVRRIVRFGAEPRAVTDEVVAGIRRHVAQLNDAGGLPAHHFHPGDLVRITSGPLSGLEGIFHGPLTPAERVRVLLRFLGSDRKVTIAVDAVEPNHNPTPVAVFKRPRRSRGVGRPIHTRVTRQEQG